MNPIDKLFQDLHPGVGEFSFDERVADVFDDMVSRSVPLYADVQRSLPLLVGLLDHQPVKIVDLGCSTGTSLIHLAQQLPDRELELIGVDNSPAMLKKCDDKIEAAGFSSFITTCCAPIESFDFSDASVVLMNYTLQFIDVEARCQMLQKSLGSLRDGGFLVLSEKVVDSNPEFNDAMVELYFEYKRRQGYTDLEISRKRDALENVLVPLTVGDNLAMLKDAGFRDVRMMLKWFNFATFLAYA